MEEEIEGQEEGWGGRRGKGRGNEEGRRQRRREEEEGRKKGHGEEEKEREGEEEERKEGGVVECVDFRKLQTCCHILPWLIHLRRTCDIV